MALSCFRGKAECDACGRCEKRAKVASCDCCGDGIYDGDGYYDVGGDPICIKCVELRIAEVG